MSDVDTVNSSGTANGRGKRTWDAPRLLRLQVSDAEVGPRPIKGDGSFTTS